MVAKSTLKLNPDSGFAGRQRALVFCVYRRVGQQISQQLEKKNMKVWLVSEEQKLLSQLNEADPDLILIEINAPTVKPIEQIMADVFAWMRGRAREIKKVLNSPSKYLWEHSRVILFKSDVEISSTTSLTAEMADTDDVVRQCNLIGDVKYVGVYYPLSFIAKVRALLE